MTTIHSLLFPFICILLTVQFWIVYYTLMEICISLLVHRFIWVSILRERKAEIALIGVLYTMEWQIVTFFEGNREQFECKRNFQSILRQLDYHFAAIKSLKNAEIYNKVLVQYALFVSHSFKQAYILTHPMAPYKSSTGSRLLSEPIEVKWKSNRGKICVVVFFWHI